MNDVWRFAGRIREAIGNPREVFTYLIRKREVSRLTKVPMPKLRAYYGEFQIFAEIHEGARAADWPIGWAEDLYVIIRALSPEVVVETGVCHGMSSTAILGALNRNGHGELFSIDAPNLDPLAMLPPGKEPGWIIPERLKSQWRLHIGLSKEILPRLLEELPPIDVFLHDSEHSYENMIFEFRAAFSHLKPGGVLLSDDTTWNSAFSDFVSESGISRTHTIRHPNIKAIRKVDT